VLFCIGWCPALREAPLPARILAVHLLCGNCLFCPAFPHKISARSETRAVIRQLVPSAASSDNEVEQIRPPPSLSVYPAGAVSGVMTRPHPFPARPLARLFPLFSRAFINRSAAV